METLFIMLGTGQNVLQNFDKREYKLTKYTLHSDPAWESIQSPFVGEAIIKLNPKRFSRIIIFGTNSSMWETLYMHIYNNETDTSKLNSVKNNFSKIWKAVSNKDIDQHPEIIEILNNSFTEYFGIITECNIVPTGETEEQLWSTFEKILNLNIQKGTISFDITHGLRYHPFFFLISLFYWNSISDGSIKLGSIFYGALELQKDPKYKGNTPIFEFKIFTDLIRWINAAEMFRKYKDPEELAVLLSLNSNTKNLSDLIKKYSFAYNSNKYSDIINLSTKLENQLQQLDEVPLPFKFVAPKLQEFANKINTQQKETGKLLKIAQQQLKYHNYSSAIIALYEAVVQEYRIQKKIDNKFKAHEEFSGNLKNFGKNIIKNSINNFDTNLNTLKNIRNIVAHLDSSSNQSEFDIETVRNLVNYFSYNLEKARFS